MIYLLDTCVISDFVKGETGTIKKLKKTRPSDIAISTIAFMEIHSGLTHNPQKAKKIQTVINELLSCITIIPYSEDDATSTAEIRTYLRKKGTPIGSYDVLIAGTAMNHELILVTANENEFRRIPKLEIENWRE